MLNPSPTRAEISPTAQAAASGRTCSCVPAATLATIATRLSMQWRPSVSVENRQTKNSTQFSSVLHLRTDDRFPLHDIQLSTHRLRVHLYLYSAAHSDGWEPYFLRDRGRFSWVGSVPWQVLRSASRTSVQGLDELDDLSDLSDLTY